MPPFYFPAFFKKTVPLFLISRHFSKNGATLFCLLKARMGRNFTKQTSNMAATSTTNTIEMSEETLPEICPFTYHEAARNNIVIPSSPTPIVVLGPVPSTTLAYRTRSPVLSIDWRRFIPDDEMIEYTTYIPFEGASPSIRPMNKTTHQALRMHIFTPPFCTNFPHLTADASIITNATTTVDAVKRMSKYLDLSMFGQGVIQIEFKAWMCVLSCFIWLFDFNCFHRDMLDDSLLQYVYDNQRLLGKHNESVDSIRALQRRMFCPRVSTKTGKRYEDSMLAKCKAFAFRSGRPVVSTATENIIPVVDEHNARINPDQIQFHDMVVCSLRYDGCYAKSGMGFGHQWVLLGVKTYGRVLEAPVEYADGTGNAENKMDGADPAYLYPEITNTSDFPLVGAH